IEELTAEKAKLETLVSTIADGALLLDANLQVILVNPTGMRIFGWEGKNALGVNVLNILPSEVQQDLARPLQEIAAGNREGGEFRISMSEPVNRTIRIVL
ncbi:PAS domain-containing protein, partial [Microcoleus sp. HI-ES]|nr:PAS domain-containing protein [Microcoleus sp. HI-ES]